MSSERIRPNHGQPSLVKKDHNTHMDDVTVIETHAGDQPEWIWSPAMQPRTAAETNDANAKKPGSWWVTYH